MARPKNKQELIEAANTNYEKLLSMIERRTEAEKSAPYDFLDDEKKKEAHWRRDRNLRDVLMHLNEWHLLLLEWVKNRENGSNKPFLLEGYNWKTYGDMNMVFFRRCQNISEERHSNGLRFTQKSDGGIRYVFTGRTFYQDLLSMGGRKLYWKLFYQ